MLNKNKIIISIISFFSLFSICSLDKNDIHFSSFEYDLSDFITNCDGVGNVYVYSGDEARVELVFYTSLYKINYVILFSKDRYEGYAEKKSYADLYDSENSVSEKIDSFNGCVSMIDQTDLKSKKYIKLSWELFQKSILN